MSALSRSVMEQLLDGAGGQLAEFKSEHRLGPPLFDQTIRVERSALPEQPPLWRVDLSASYIDESASFLARVKRAKWSTWHTDLAEALIQAGDNADRFRWSLYEKGCVG